jgi:hypothetical protein
MEILYGRLLQRELMLLKRAGAATGEGRGNAARGRAKEREAGFRSAYKEIRLGVGRFSWGVKYRSMSKANAFAYTGKYFAH